MEKAISEAWQRKVSETEQLFDEKTGLVYEKANGINYHTAVTGGIVHKLLTNAEYIPALYARGTAEDIRRAEKILRCVLAEQDKNPNNETYGVWPYLFEEPLSSMKNPDWNWVAFIGRVLLTLQYEFPTLLTEELKNGIREAMLAACESVVRRKMGVDYTNISLMTSFIMVATGEVYDAREYFDYGINTLRRQVDFIRHNSNYAEYNSPYYGVVDLEETGRMLRYFRSAEGQALGQQLHDAAWKVYAEHYHQPTRQVAPPHARCYADVQNTRIPTLIVMGTNGKCRPVADEELMVDLLWPFINFRCPEKYQPYFGALTAPKIVEEAFYRGYDPIANDEARVLIEKGTPNLDSYTYLTPDYCLGSFARHDMWNQRRPLMAYVATPSGVACFRARCLHEDMDFASALMMNQQEKNALCGGISFVTDHGDYHYILTPLKNATITADRFTVNFTVTGALADVAVKQTGNGKYNFKMGAKTLRLTILEAKFDGKTVEIVPIDTPTEKGICCVLSAKAGATINFSQLNDSYLLYTLDVVENENEEPVSVFVEKTAETSVIRLAQGKEPGATVAHRPTTYLPPMPGLEKRFRKGGFYYVQTEQKEQN